MLEDGARRVELPGPSECFGIRFEECGVLLGFRKGHEKRGGRRRIALAKQALRVQKSRAAVVGHQTVRALIETQRLDLIFRGELSGA